jgi:MOSC domain-containing protein YiiM
MNQPVVISVNISEQKGTRKHPVRGPATITMQGMQGDAHAGDWHRQLSLLAQESIDKMQGYGLVLQPGDFAENITTQGLDLLTLPVGTRLQIGSVVTMEVTQIGKECHLGCEIRKLVGDCVMPREGIFARIITPGPIEAGDIITILSKGENHDSSSSDHQR